MRTYRGGMVGTRWTTVTFGATLILLAVGAASAAPKQGEEDILGPIGLMEAEPERQIDWKKRAGAGFLSAAFVLVALGLMRRRRRRRRALAVAQAAARLTIPDATAELPAAEFYAELTCILRQAVARAHVPGAKAMTARRLASAPLDIIQTHAETRRNWRRLLERSERAEYAGHEIDRSDLLADLEFARAILQRLAAVRPPRERPRGV